MVLKGMVKSSMVTVKMNRVEVVDQVILPLVRLASMFEKESRLMVVDLLIIVIIVFG